MLRVRDIRAFAGPNVYSHEPVLAMTLDLESLAGCDSCDLPGFVDRLLEALPGLADHHCASRAPGGFVARLRSGTYAGHVVEHVALELSEAAGIGVHRGKTLATDEPGVYLVTVACRCEPAMSHLLRASVEFVDALVAGLQYPLGPVIDTARRLAETTALGPTTRAIVDAAERRGIPWTRVDDGSLVRLGYGAAIRYIQAATTSATSLIAADLAGDKHETKQRLMRAGIPAPRGCVARTLDEAQAWIAGAELPVVIKPLDGNQGRGVSLNLHSPEDIADAFTRAQTIAPRVIVEEMYQGLDYRVLVVGGRMVAAAQRVPAHVWGNGVHSIRALVDRANADPRRGEDHEKPLTKIRVDAGVETLLRRHGRTLDDVPAPGELVLLRESANLSSGGEARDVTDDVHPTMRRMCERAVRVIGLDVAGVDLVVPDISQPFVSGGIVEVNAAPGIRMHHAPSEGRPRDAGGAIVDALFPAGANGRIPIVAITGTNGKTTVARLIRHAIAATGRTVGLTCTDGIWIGGDEIARGDMAGPWSAGLVLSDPAVEVAVLETARGGILHGGLAWDWCDVGVITNIQSDHVGQDGIDTMADLAHVKRLVAERVRPHGTLVLNADDPELVAWPEHPALSRTPRTIVFFSLSATNPHVERHVNGGGTAFICRDGWIEERAGTKTARIARLASVPATFDGTSACQTANVLAAVAACRAQGLDRSLITRALRSFRIQRDSAGRLNLYELNGAFVLVDYGHNPPAVAEVHRLARAWRAPRVHLVVGAPGDRSDALLADVAREAAAFDRIVVREDRDRRGREPGDVGALLVHHIRRTRPEAPVALVLDELAAIDWALADVRPGEVLVALCERVADVRRWIQDRGARPMDRVARRRRPVVASGAPARLRLASRWRRSA